MIAKKFFQLKRGFTLIEILVAISLVSIFSAFLIINFRSNEESREFRQTSLLVMDGIKKVQTMSLANEAVNNKIPGAYAFFIDNCVFDECFYELMAYKGSGDLKERSNYELITSFKLEKKVSVEADDIKIIFLPTRADTKIFINGEEKDFALIKLIHKNNSLVPLCVSVSAMSGRISSSKCGG